MTDWISDAKTACEAFSDAKTLRGEKILEYQMTINAALPRALKALREEQAKNEKTEAALRAADELEKWLRHYDDCMFSSAPCHCGLDEALAAYQKARK